MKNFRLIDFSSIELPKGFIPSTDGKTTLNKAISSRSEALSITRWITMKPSIK